jgi:hypothetical protein
VRRGRVGLVLGLAVLALAMAALEGCGSLTGKLTGAPKDNTPPNTVLFVNGAVDTVNHVAHLYWFGSDPDGIVTGFEWQLRNPATPADTAWHFTTLTDSVFTIQAPSGYTDPIFSVRAIDNAGARDPSPPRQTFQFSNQAPTVRITGKPLPTDTTFASVSVQWTATDVDGDLAKMVYLVWLDGNEASPEITTATSFTMPSARFNDAGGNLIAGPRKLYVRAVDDGGRAGPPDSVLWTVRHPVTGTQARLLILDEVPRINAANLRFDTLYSNSVARVGLTTGEYTIVRLETANPFRTAEDFRQTFELFEAVVWYRGNEITFSPPLLTAEPGIRQYLDNGGRFYLDGLYLFSGRNATGPLSEDFVRSHLNSHGLLSAFTITTTFADTSAGFGNTGTSVFLPHIDVHGTIVRDSIYVRQALQVRSGEAGGLRQFDFKDRDQVLLWGAPGTLTPAIGDSTAVGISVPQPNGGRAIVVCMPPGAAVPAAGPGAQAGSAARFVTNVYRHLGLDLPPAAPARRWAAMR